MSRFSAVVVLWFSTEAAEAALLLFDRFIAIEKKIYYLSDKNDFSIPRQILSRNQNKNLSADWSVGNLRGKTIKTKLIYLDPKSLLQFNGQRIQSFFLDTFVTLVQHI